MKNQGLLKPAEKQKGGLSDGGRNRVAELFVEVRIAVQGGAR